MRPLALLLACSCSSPSTPEVLSPTITVRTPVPVDASPAPAPQPEPAPPPKPPPDRQDLKDEPSMAVVESPNPFDGTSSVWDGTGWYCTTVPGDEPLEGCYRTEKYCEKMRVEQARISGSPAEPCAFNKSATCLLVKMDGVERAVALCHLTEKKCEHARSLLKAEPRNFVSDCKTLD